MCEPPFSTDANLLHTSSEGKLLEDPWLEPPEHIFSRTKSIEDTPDNAEIIIIRFEKISGEIVEATIVDPVFYDKSGSKQNV